MTKTPAPVMGVREIQEYLPHRYPFLFVDRVDELEPGKYIRACKQVTANEPFFPGHFPGYPILPGVLAVEALAQASALLGLKTIDERGLDGAMCYLTGADGYRFRRMVYPGEQLELYSELRSIRSNMGRFNCRASVDGQEVCAGTITCVYQPRPETE